MRGLTLLPILLCAAAWCLDEAHLQGVLDGFEARTEQVLRSQVAKPYPPTGAWRYTDFALAALRLNEKVDEANQAILELHEEFPVDPDPQRAPGDPEVNDAHWQINLMHRIYFLFSSKSAFFPGRLSAEAEDALLDMIWKSAYRHCRIEYADPEKTWWIWGSENHGAMSRSGFWGSAQILKDAEDYKDRRYEDGSTPAQMAAAWDEFFKRYATERASKGMLVETASTYNKYTLQGWYNMVDFAQDPVLRKRMEMLLDLFWADWATEQIDGVRGGGKHRIYAGPTSTRGTRYSGSGMSWYYFGTGVKESGHPGHLCAATSDYRPPLCVVDMALDVEGRGVYEYTSRRPGLNLLPKPEGADWQTYVLRPDFGGILRYTYCTPDFIMGTSMVESRSAEEWSAISSQNRWDGIVFAGQTDACIFAQPLKPERGSVYNSHWTVQSKGTMILQKLRTHKHARAQRVWFADSLEVTEEGGWVFAKAPRALAAVRVVSGDTTWEDAGAADSAEGRWLTCADEFTPIIFEVARKGDFADLDAFKQAIVGNAVAMDGGTLRYKSPIYGDELTFYTDYSEVPRINGEPVDYEPESVYDSPFIKGDWAEGIVTLEKDGRRVVLDFTAE